MRYIERAKKTFIENTATIFAEVVPILDESVKKKIKTKIQLINRLIEDNYIVFYKN